MTRRVPCFLAGAASLGIMLLAAGCAGGGTPAAGGLPAPAGGTASARGPSAVAGSAPAGSLSARLVLPAGAIVAGSTVTARVLIDNQTGHSVHFADCAGEAYEIELWAGGYHPGGIWPACLGNDVIPAGQSARVVRFIAAYDSCTPRGPVPADARACLPDGGMPALPPGTYQAVTFPADPGTQPVPGPVTVHLVAAGS